MLWQYDKSRKSFYLKKSFYYIGLQWNTLVKCNLWSLDFAPFYQKIRIDTPDILRPSHDVKSYFFPCKSQKLLQFGILEARWYEKMPFLHPFRILWSTFELFGAIIHDGWHQHQHQHPHHHHRMSENWWKSFFEKLIPFYIWLNVKFNLSFF